jgi:tetratricopeptide repeat protein
VQPASVPGAALMATTLPAFALLATASLASAQVLSPAYRTLVVRYASGDRLGAADDLCSWPDSRIKREVPILNGDWQKTTFGADAMSVTVWAELPIRAALMLHTDCVQRAPGDRKLPGPHIAAAWSIARAMTQEPALRPFARRWYEAFAELAQAEYRWGHALDWAERGLDDFPGSAALWLVRGSIQEMQAVQAAQAQPTLPPERADAQSNLLQRRDVEQYLQAARKSLQAAIHADPSLAEAHLRLGRVAWRLGDEAGARAELEAAVARSREPRTSYLAQLFLGRLEEDAGRFSEAAARYEAAVAIDGGHQSGRLALSHARLRLGEPDAARREVDASLASAGRRRERDPLWLYPWGPAVGVDERLDAMRQEASRP